jgi:hypothetical protein
LPGRTAEFPGGITPLGALEVWMYANGHVTTTGEYSLTRELLNQFKEQLAYLNSVFARLVGPR